MALFGMLFAYHPGRWVGSATDTQWVESRDVAACALMHQIAPQQRTVWLQTSVVLRMKNPGLKSYSGNCSLLSSPVCISALGGYCHTLSPHTELKSKWKFEIPAGWCFFFPALFAI